jgi:hypothetical protein
LGVVFRRGASGAIEVTGETGVTGVRGERRSFISSFSTGVGARFTAGSSLEAVLALIGVSGAGALHSPLNARPRPAGSPNSLGGENDLPLPEVAPDWIEKENS